MVAQKSPQHDKPCQRTKTDKELLTILACGATVEQTARQLKISERTIYRRLADPKFKSALQEARAEMVQRTSGTLTASAGEAVRTLIALLNPNSTGMQRLGAARAIIELGMKLREMADLEQRVLELEQQVAALTGPDLKLHTAAES